MFDLLLPTDASTVLLRTDNNSADMPAVTMPTDYLTRQYLLQKKIFFRPSSLYNPGDPRGALRGGLFNGLGRAFLKGGVES